VKQEWKLLMAEEKAAATTPGYNQRALDKDNFN